MSLEPGSSIADYEIVEPIGAGGMGEVYRARDEKLGRDVVIKILRDETTRTLWALSIADGSEHQQTALDGRRGFLRNYAPVGDGEMSLLHLG